MLLGDVILDDSWVWTWLVLFLLAALYVAWTTSAWQPGVIVAAVIVTSFGLPMWQDLLIEYVARFVIGPFIFQALFMRGMAGDSYTLAAHDLRARVAVDDHDGRRQVLRDDPLDDGTRHAGHAPERAAVLARDVAVGVRG